MQALGKHILVEFYGCNPEKLKDTKMLQTEFENAADMSGATVVDSTFHTFSPYGVSGVVVIAESHLTIHTWPEYGYAAVDLFTCGDTVDPWKAFSYLKSVLESNNTSTIEMKRGQLNDFEGQLRHKPACA
ncbi:MULTISPECIES: adenosylmethionine decarboxylase [Flexistipes]|uniref:S-adenosylmethionine decarboxylase proenzyme n=1 Tax=Flexistipes sinusarabici (strain ATCC 49648 / DSM 4947 / MAS 10) TaxID=717231 RepID=F8E6K3_FLESM|nr:MULTISPECIES: adenosylmethionine decarboxylase [Flexistipes]AEI14840.1 S-adenosylmethionine decarboxylase proenzyme [Flexistipes sinusarabici DSM 4947]MEC9492770.1 adenosylmethionine decarboxylase [Flexistipes sp.]